MSKKLIVAIVIGLFFVTFAPATLAVVAADAPIMVHLVDDGWDDVDAVGKPPKDPPAQPRETIPWGITRIGADIAQSSPIFNTGTDVGVAVLDTGVDLDHPDLLANIAPIGVNFVSNRGVVDPTKYDDDNGHGTHVSGTIAAIDNGIGVVGVAPNATIFAVKVLDKRGSGSLENVIAGIDWVIAYNEKSGVNEENDIDIISMSLSTNYNDARLEAACQRAFNAGIVIVAAAGNDGGAVDYPAAYDNYVIAVAATDSSDYLASFSSRGPEIDLAAPGVGTYSTYKGGAYATMSGTSMACPHVSGTVALVLKTTDPNGNGWDPTEVKNELLNTADYNVVKPTILYGGYGLVDADQSAV